MGELLTIPKRLTKRGDLVIIPRSEYEEFLHWQRSVKTFKPTVAEKKALEEARKDFARGNYITLEELKNELEGCHSS